MPLINAINNRAVNTFNPTTNTITNSNINKFRVFITEYERVQNTVICEVEAETEEEAREIIQEEGYIDFEVNRETDETEVDDWNIETVEEI